MASIVGSTSVPVSSLGQRLGGGDVPFIVQARSAIETHVEMQRRDERLGIVKRRLVLEPHEGAVGEHGRVGFDRLELVAVFEHRMRDRP